MCDLKVGDKVVINSRCNFSIRTIDRETKTLFIIGNMRFNKHTLSESGGDSWSSLRIVRKATPDDFTELTKQQNIKIIKKYDYSKMEPELITKIINIINLQEGKLK